MPSNRLTQMLGAMLLLAAHAQAARAQDVLPLPPTAFKGTIQPRATDSKPDFPQPIHAPAGAPNVVVVLLDDVGYGASSTFGGPVHTPTLESLAQNGLRYTQFHTTALCSPTRAALLTGRNHHSVHTGTIMETGTGFPGYDTVMGKDTATMAEVMKQMGWNTAWFGKNHNVPDWQGSQAGPFDLWPMGLGFEKFYGFIGGDSHQWRPAVIDGTKPIEPYLGRPDYNFDYDIADQAIAWVRSQKTAAPDRPFFLYYAPGATHAPHHPRKEWIAKYKGKFDQGWDKQREQTFAQQKKLGVIPENAKLTPRPAEIGEWNALSADQKKLYARFMEVYAGYLEQTDYNVGRVLKSIAELGQLDNTLVIYIVGDNGASAEGSPQGLLNENTFFNAVPEDLKMLLAHIDDIGSAKTFNHYPVGWAHAMDTPFQWTKQIASHFGGTRNGMVVSWPAGIKDKGGIRTQFHHVIDVAPTVLEACKLKLPKSVNGVKQKPVEGVSMSYSFGAAEAPSKRKTQYFEMLGNRAVYSDGWVAATTPTTPPWVSIAKPVDAIDGYQWELYHVAEDFSEADNLAAKEPAKLKALQALFYKEARKFNVLPIDNRKVERLDASIRPSLTRGRTSFDFFAAQGRIPEGASPDTKNKSFRLSASIEASGKDNGVLVTQGGAFGGYALFLKDGKLVYHYNLAGVSRYEVAAPSALSAGKHAVVLDFRYDGGGPGKGGTATISVDGKQVAQGRIERTLPFRLSLDEGLDVGEDSGTAASPAYDVPYAFTGKLHKLTIDIAPK